MSHVGMDLFEHIKLKFGEENFKRVYFRDASVYHIADQVLLVRKELGLTKKELAQKAGVGQRAISNIENAETGLSLESLIKIADALDLSLRGKLVPLRRVNSQIDK